ncbi:MAG: PTS transporter subunit EIIB [Promicromonosporaceae bacterium]|nr:PTS transporter subunit EIIB [Promicromonosporaceae bacterium]
MSRAEQILSGLGGAGNILELDPCITRLRVKVTDPKLVEESQLTRADVRGVVASGRIIQVIIGPEADVICQELAALLDSAGSKVDVQF